MTGLLVVTALAMGAATLAGREPATREMSASLVAATQERRGPNSTQVVAFLESLRATTPLVCEMISDQVGNFWFGERGLGIGRFADARAEVRREKEAITAGVRDPGAIRHLASRLGDEDPCVRFLAAKMLGNSAASDDVIGRLLDDRSPRVREAALRAAAEGERAGLRGRVERLLEEPDAAVGAMAAYALGEYEQRGSVGPLRRALRHEAAPVRAAAAWALGQIEDATVAPDLDALLTRETDRRVRVATIEAIGNLDGLRVPPQSVVRAVSDPDRVVMVAAIETLVGFDDDTSLAPVLLPHITDADPHVRLMVIEALGEMRLRSAVPAITRALRDPDPEVRRAAIEALAEIDDQDH